MPVTVFRHKVRICSSSESHNFLNSTRKSSPIFNTGQSSFLLDSLSSFFLCHILKYLMESHLFPLLIISSSLSFWAMSKTRETWLFSFLRARPNLVLPTSREDDMYQPNHTKVKPHQARVVPVAKMTKS